MVLVVLWPLEHEHSCVWEQNGRGEGASFPMDLPISASPQMPPLPSWGNALWMQVERRC